MKTNKKLTKKTEQEHTLLTFLKRTKAGKYAKISPGILRYIRMGILREEPCFQNEDAYYYSTR